MAQLEHIEAIEKRLWSAADTQRANSTFASNEFFLPVMGLVFLRHAYSRYLAVKDEQETNLPSRGGKKRELTKNDFSGKGAIYLCKEAQFDYLVGLPDGTDRAAAIIGAMESIEGDYETLRGVLPKDEYNELDNEILGSLLRTLNPEELKHMSGDVFGRIYEYFLTQFAGQGAHDGGEFFRKIKYACCHDGRNYYFMDAFFRKPSVHDIYRNGISVDGMTGRVQFAPMGGRR